jgi:hypothetical protein
MHTNTRLCRLRLGHSVAYTIYGKKPAERVTVGDDPRKEVLRCAETGRAVVLTTKCFTTRNSVLYINGNIGDLGTDTVTFLLTLVFSHKHTRHGMIQIRSHFFRK